MNNANNTSTLRIRNEANLTSYGTHRHHACKPVIAVDIQKTFNSVLDAAEYFGVCPDSIINVLKGRQTALRMYERDENGNRIRFIGTCRLTYAAHAETAMDAVMKCGRKSQEELSKANARIAELERKAKMWDAYEAEQEKKHKEEEAHAMALDKANKKVERKQRIFDRLMNELLEAEVRLNEAKMERDALLKGDDE